MGPQVSFFFPYIIVLKKWPQNQVDLLFCLIMTEHI